MKSQELLLCLGVSRRGLAFSALPAVLMLVGFYALAIHMRASLGGWPTAIGTAGFPESLRMHGEWVLIYTYVLFVLSLIFVPPGIMLGFIVARWRPYLPYFGIHALVYLLCWMAMRMAPEPFLYWWRD